MKRGDRVCVHGVIDSDTPRRRLLDGKYAVHVQFSPGASAWIDEDDLHPLNDKDGDA